jgi:6-phosphogluconolactonase
MTTHARIEIASDPKTLSLRAAELFEKQAAEAISQRSIFAVALSGGSTPKLLHSKLSKRTLPWDHIHLFWGDERCVPPDFMESNFRMVCESLLDFIKIPPQNIHRMKGEIDPPQAASLYEEELKTFFGRTHFPRFDLIFLGLGDDGHTASLFPGAAALNENIRWVVDTPSPASSHRLTLTFPVLNAASIVCFLVAGSAKAAVFKRVAHQRDVSLPAARVQPENGELLFLADRAAAEIPQE